MNINQQFTLYTMIPLQRDCKGDESSYLCLRIIKKEVERRRLPKRKEGQAKQQNEELVREIGNG